ncbi:MAG: Peptidase M50, partial [Candidatus Nomurabacteria bacterium GW2011_GWB1_37_5]
YYGDQTAKHAGRLTLNPIKHIDPVGSILVPLLLVMSGSGILFGWAKPVPYNPYNLRDQKWGNFWVAAAGIISNLLIAIFFSILIRFGMIYVADFSSSAFFAISKSVVILNIVLAIFNLVPIPPLDGSKILFTFLPYHFNNIQQFLEKYSLILMLGFIFFIWKYFAVLIFLIFHSFTGVGF